MRWSRFCHTGMSDRRVLAFFSCIVASLVLCTVCATVTNSPPYKRCSLLACLLYQGITSIVDAHLVTFEIFL
uniref:Putative secreted protein n=1 Tax=Ixodes ricinus TaxID=34613 RepID=A0A147BUW4_IXORI